MLLKSASFCGLIFSREKEAGSKGDKLNRDNIIKAIDLDIFARSKYYFIYKNG